MFGYALKLRSCCLPCKVKPSSAKVVWSRSGVLLAAGILASLGAVAASAQQAQVVVQPGAPGEPSKTLPASTHATLPPLANADVQFMKGMIMHHQQAVEMTALIASHTDDKDVHTLGAKITSSQSDEIRFMQRWLATRGQATSMEMPGMPGMDMSAKPMAPMPGMLTPEQMERSEEH